VPKFEYKGKDHKGAVVQAHKEIDNKIIRYPIFLVFAYALATCALRSFFMDASIHQHYMREAIKQAKIAFSKAEVPVGAVVVYENKIIARAYNQCEMLRDPTAHAEMIAMTQASEALSHEKEGHRGSLEKATLYVTLEPCAMCSGALVLTKCENLVFGTLDPKAGACQSLYRIPQDERLNHRLNLTGGVLAEECRILLQEFFRTLRKN